MTNQQVVIGAALAVLVVLLVRGRQPPAMLFTGVAFVFVLLGYVTLPNRVLMGSMHTGLEDRAADYPRLAEYFAERARGGVGLIVTGGSDFHQPIKNGIVMGAGRGNLKIPYRCVEEIRAKIPSGW